MLELDYTHVKAFFIYDWSGHSLLQRFWSNAWQRIGPLL